MRRPRWLQACCAAGVRAAREFRYVTCRDWSLDEVGRFWDGVTDYDEINESTYSYFRRFTNSWDLAGPHVGSGMFMLDIQARSGKGTEFWMEKGVVDRAVVADFSDFLLELAQARLDRMRDRCRWVKVTEFPLPFENGQFDLVASYETIEHIADRAAFVAELSRVLKAGGLLILTCPNVLWEPMHWLAAIFGIHHSEGPHNFPLRRTLLSLFRRNGLSILEENTTILLPFNQAACIRVNERLETTLPARLLRLCALRRSFVLRKEPGYAAT